jgi:hypothetical protein
MLLSDLVVEIVVPLSNCPWESVSLAVPKIHSVVNGPQEPKLHWEKYPRISVLHVSSSYQRNPVVTLQDPNLHENWKWELLDESWKRELRVFLVSSSSFASVMSFCLRSEPFPS